jgi:hypothetical protein
MCVKGNSYTTLDGKPEGKITFSIAVAVCYENGNESLCSVNDWEFLDWLSDYQNLKKNLSKLVT